MTLVASIATGSAPKLMYTAIMLPAIVARPPTISASSSDCVIFSTYGLTISGASVTPIRTFAAADNVSAPLVPSKCIIGFAMVRTTNCSTPK